jgi:hypothetical protein
MNDMFTTGSACSTCISKNNYGLYRDMKTLFKTATSATHEASTEHISGIKTKRYLVSHDRPPVVVSVRLHKELKDMHFTKPCQSIHTIVVEILNVLLEILNAITNLFLLSFVELSSCRNNFLGSGTAGLPGSGRGVGSQSALGIEDMHLDFPCIRASKNEFCGGTENSTFDSLTGGLSSARKTRHIDEIAKFESPGQKAVALWAYAPSPWPCINIPVKEMGICPSPAVAFVCRCILGIAVFVWSILSWIIQRTSVRMSIEFVLQEWYNRRHVFW